MNMDIAWLARDSLQFPPLDSALKQPNGLLAFGGDLSPERLINAYRLGIFPWYEQDQPILWWSPDPRCVLFPDEMHVSRSLAKRLRNTSYTLTMDEGFEAVIAACAEPRAYTDGTWINSDMMHAYRRLFRLGIAHSVEVWDQDRLVGGLYGLALGQVFFGESMFSCATDASKIALARLCSCLTDWGYRLIDCQVDNPHLRTLGARLIPRTEFEQFLTRYARDGGHDGVWTIS